MLKKLWLVRHARPLVDDGICYGATDVAADAPATTQLAQWLASGIALNAEVLSSPLQRCLLVTTQLQSLRPDLHIRVDVRLSEMNFGVWEGVPWAQIPPHALQDWTDNFADHKFGGVESANDVLQRVATLWDACDENTSDQVWITHAGVIRAASLLAAGRLRVEQASDWPSAPIPYGACFALSESGLSPIPLTAQCGTSE